MRYLALLLVPIFTLCAAAVEGSAPRQLTFASGKVTVGEGLATMTVPENCRYLANDDARFWVEKLWHNPHDPEIIGMVVPVELSEWYAAKLTTKEGEPAPDYPARSWGMIVSWGGETGHVKDDDARATDFAALLKDMQESTREGNAERIKAGYDSIELLGWAEPPHYDAETKKLYWAKSLRFRDDSEPTLNYCVRILGARGVLELNAVDEQKALKQVAESAQLVLAATELNPGNRYADFKEGLDPVAAGGIAALVAGGVLAQKAGLLAIFGVFILKFLKILVVPAIFIGTWIRRKIKERKESASKVDPRDHPIR